MSAVGSGSGLATSRKSLRELVGARGFEPPTTRSRTECATRLRYAPRRCAFIRDSGFFCKGRRPGRRGPTGAGPRACRPSSRARSVFVSPPERLRARGGECRRHVGPGEPDLDGGRARRHRQARRHAPASPFLKEKGLSQKDLVVDGHHDVTLGNRRIERQAQRRRACRGRGGTLRPARRRPRPRAMRPPAARERPPSFWPSVPPWPWRPSCARPPRRRPFSAIFCPPRRESPRRPRCSRRAARTSSAFCFASSPFPSASAVLRGGDERRPPAVGAAPLPAGP